MNETIHMHMTAAELSAAVTENLYALFRAMRVLPGHEIVETGRLSYHHAFPTNPMFKGVWRVRLDPAEYESAIDEALAWFEQRQARMLFWWTGGEAEPAGLIEQLVRRGFARNVRGDPGMAIELAALSASAAAPPGFTIHRAADRESLEAWRDVFAASYEVPLFAGQAWVDATLAAGPEQAPWQLYLGCLDGRPVATNILFKGAGVAGIYGVGTLPEARRKGIGAAITLKPLLDAREQGYRYGVLYASEEGYPVYRRMGFRELPVRVGRYLLVKG
jgi:ribosomal protein S18 acetylase RimI-like enzyme